MWFLQNSAKASCRFSLPVGKDLIIGRKDCDVLIEGDQSISRRHAILHVTGNVKDSKVTLTDCKSKFGSLVNGRKLSSNETVELSLDSQLKFGQSPTTGTFKLVFESLVFCCSSMTSAEKQRVKQLAKNLHGRVVNSWSSECTHLVMTRINVTIKVVSALSSCRPIVTPAWLEGASQCFADNEPLPSTDSYLPEVVDSNLDGDLVSFKPDFDRKFLFQDRTVYFLSENQFATLHQCVKSAGARCVDASVPGSVDLERLTAKESVVLDQDEDLIQGLPPQQMQWVEQVKHFLQSRELRMVKDSEIGFALLYNSIETHCNPRSKDGVVEDVDCLPAPSLSQLPATQLTQDQQPLSHQPQRESQLSPLGHPSTLSQSSISRSVLAPDSQSPSTPSPDTVQSEPKHLVSGADENSSTGSAGSASSVMKINETVYHRSSKSRHRHLSNSEKVSEVDEVHVSSSRLRLKKGGRAAVKRKLDTSSSSPEDVSGPPLKQPALDMLFGDSEPSPIEVKSKICTGLRRGRDVDDPVTSTQAGRDLKDADNNRSFSVVDDSASTEAVRLRGKDRNLTDTKLPGLKTSHNSDDVVIVGTKGHSKPSATKGWAESQYQAPPSQDAGGSVLVPSSLTPSSQLRKAADSSLPSSGLMSDFFQGKLTKKKKRGADALTDDVVCIEDEEAGTKEGGSEGAERPAAKKMKGEMTISPEHASEVKPGGGGLFGGLQSKRKSKKESSSVKINGSGGDSATKKSSIDYSDSVMGMENTTGPVPRSGSQLGLQSQTQKSSKSEISSPTPEKDDKLSYRDRFSRPLDTFEKTPQTPSVDSNDESVKSKKTPVNNKTPFTSPSGLFSPFLSTRKRKSKSSPREKHPTHQEESKISADHRMSPNSSVTSSLFANTENAEAVPPSHNATETVSEPTTASTKQQLFTSPFTLLATQVSKFAPPGTVTVLGRRTKVKTNGNLPSFGGGGQDKGMTAADALWNEGDNEGLEGDRRFDGEHPLGTQFEDGGSSQIGVYKPVYAEDGFIEPRSQPKLQVSRLGRLALRARRALLTSPGSEKAEDSTQVGGAEGVADSQPVAEVEIVKLSLVARKAGEKKKERESDNVGGATVNGLKNFKKFSKTRNTNSSDGIPRFINLKYYVPKDDFNLPDWNVSETREKEPAAESQAYSSDEDEDDVFSFVKYL